ncbi:hypothetical protein [Streptomyces kanamyceticus]|nr:hypothetical protein [Streptomyces kanamyceticus]
MKNVVVFGDNLSDIGNRWIWPTERSGRSPGTLCVNESGRFSDGKNWTDFLVEWSTGDALMWGNSDLTIRKSADYRTLSRHSVLDVDPGDEPPEMRPWRSLDAYAYVGHPGDDSGWERRPTPTPQQIRYVNYAMGGCVVSRDRAFTRGLGSLSCLRGQVEDYLAQRSFLGAEFDGPTLHVLWAGLNDFVTVERPDHDRTKARNLPSTNDYTAWQTWSRDHPEESEDGVGAFPAVAETRSLIESIVSDSPGVEADQYFMVVDLPNVYGGAPVIDRYNALLASLVADWPRGVGAPAQGHVHLVTMSKWMAHVGRDPTNWQLSSESQPAGIRPFYDARMPSVPDRDPVPTEVRRCATTSDPRHPTQAVHSLMARYFVAALLKSGHALGRLDNDTCPLESPLSALPLDIPTT